MDLVLPSADNNSEITSLLNKAYESRINNLTLSVQLAEEALKLSRESKDNELIGKSLNQLSLFYMIMGAHNESMQMSKEAIGYFKVLGDEKGIADAKYNIAGIYYKTNNYHLGLIYLTECLIIYKKFEDFHNQARTYKSLGTIYEYIGDEKNAVKSYEKAIETSRNAGDINLESNAYNPLSGIYLKNGEVDKALNTIERAIKMKQASGDIRGIAFSLYGRAKVYAAKEWYERAEEDYCRAITIHQEMNERLGLAMAYRKLGLLYIETERYEDAKNALNKALEVSEKYNIVIISFKSNYLLYEVHKRQQDPVMALKYLEHYLQEKETVINLQTLQVIENYELINKMDSLEKEALLKKERAEIIRKKDIAEQAFKVRQEFLSTMSHEIRTPLNAVITISSLLKDRSNDEEKQLLSSLKFAANNLLLIINDILDFTKLDSGKAQLETRQSNFFQLLENIKNTYDSLAKEKGLTLLLDIGPSIYKFYELDETKISQILGNLVSNAIKFTDEGNVIIDIKHVARNEDVDEVNFKVHDTGHGIPEKYHHTIFNSFSQPQIVTTRKQGGSGLGLAIVKQLIELHDSRVFIKSEVGIGSTFYFTLKLKQGKEPVIAQEKRLGQLKNKKILLAEDNMVNAMVLTKLLSKWGISTVHVKNGIEAIEKAGEIHFDFILMDIHMPEMNGFDATKQIRQNSGINAQSPIFALTADITAQHLNEYAPHFSGFLNKPIEIDKLYEALIKVS